MDTLTGKIYTGTEAQLKEQEEKLHRILTRIPNNNVESLRGLSHDDRIGAVKKLIKRRKKNKVARKSRKNNR